MRVSARELGRYRVHATDGAIGRLGDLLFDDQAWVVRHLVVSVGPWLVGRKVLVSPGAFERADSRSSSVHLRLTRAEVRASPDLMTQPPVSRWHVAPGSTDFQGWPSPWTGYSVWGPAVWPLVPEMDGLVEQRRQPGSPDERAAHRLSIRDVIGYRITTGRGELGRVWDFLLEDTTFAIECLVAQVKRGHSHQTLPVLREQVLSIDWLRRTVTADFGRAAKEHDASTSTDTRADAHSP